MAYQINHRPKEFKDFIGNKQIIKSMESLFEDKNHPHSFMFTGDSGCGKTTLARIVASIVSCSENEFYEINTANNRGIDFIRSIIDSSKYRPMMGNSKVYLFDEFHQTTLDAQNALLKLIEDYPKHCYFIFCSTNPAKIIKTIQTRCTKYNVSRLTDKEILKLLNRVLKTENLKIKDEILDLIIDSSGGVPRDALVLLEQLKDIKKIEKAKKLIYGGDKSRDVIDLCRVLIKKKKKSDEWKEILNIVNNIEPLDNNNVETVRISIYSYFCSCLKNSSSIDDVHYYVKLMEIFLEPFNYATGKQELFHRLAIAYMLT